MEITVVPRGTPSSGTYTYQEFERLDIDPEIAELTNSLGSMLGELSVPNAKFCP